MKHKQKNDGLRPGSGVNGHRPGTKKEMRWIHPLRKRRKRLSRIKKRFPFFVLAAFAGVYGLSRLADYHPPAVSEPPFSNRQKKAGDPIVPDKPLPEATDTGGLAAPARLTVYLPLPDSTLQGEKGRECLKTPEPGYGKKKRLVMAQP